MDKPGRISTFLYGLIGKAWAYDTTEQVREAIARRSFTTLAEYARTHAAGAGRLDDALCFQPGLVALHDDLHDTWHYLTALWSRAQELGELALTEQLAAAIEATSEALRHVAAAAESTTGDTATASPST